VLGAVRTLTLRLPEAVHEQLRELAFHSRRSQHSLAMEGLNCLFERKGKPPIAPV
jgi:predicted transcriptional regulator